MRQTELEKKERRRQRRKRLIRAEADYLARKGRFAMTAQYMQHGGISVQEHCLRVADTSLRIADCLPVRVNRRNLVRGALLHDYFLYDWHEKDASHRLHGFFHPGKALRNAKEDFLLTRREEDIILRHMFPLTLVPPGCADSWIVCAADKICAAQETFGGLIGK